MPRKVKSQAIDSELGNTASDQSQLIALAVKIVSSYVSANQVPAGEIAGIIRSVHQSLREASGGFPDQTTHKPAVAVRKSIEDDYITCLEDGKKLRTLKRYLRTHYEMTPEEYRAKWGLPPDYPMVAPSYAKLRSAFAKKIGLGRTPAPRFRRART